MRIAKMLVGLSLAVGAWFGPAAWADDTGGSAAEALCGESVTGEILGILLDAGNIDRARYDALCARARGASELPPVAAPAPDGEPTWNFEWANGFRVSRSDGAFKLKFGGRAMLDSAFVWQQDGLRDRFEAAAIDPREGSGVEFRRARLFFSGTVYERAFFKVQYEFAEAGIAEFKDVYMGLKNLGPVGSLQVGNFKEPFMLQEWTGSKYITFMERGLNDVFFPGRNVGLMGMGNAFDQKVFWQLGLFRVTDDRGEAFDSWSEAEYDLAARVSAAPIYSDDGARVLHLGVDYIHRFNQDTASFRQRPEADLAQRFVSTGSIPASDSDLLNLEAAVVYGPFSAQSEWTFDWVEGRGTQQDVDFWGGYVSASYFLTGEHRNYEKGRGRFGRLEPRESFDPGNGDWGAWEIAARYSVLDLDDRNVAGGKLWDVTAGLNWYLYPNLRWMFNYVHGDVRQREVSVLDNMGVLQGVVGIRGAADIFETRFQLDF